MDPVTHAPLTADQQQAKRKQIDDLSSAFAVAQILRRWPNNTPKTPIRRTTTTK